MECPGAVYGGDVEFPQVYRNSLIFRNTESFTMPWILKRCHLRKILTYLVSYIDY